jgi:hypothetical protein
MPEKGCTGAVISPTKEPVSCSLIRAQTRRTQGICLLPQQSRGNFNFVLDCRFGPNARLLGDRCAASIKG